MHDRQSLCDVFVHKIFDYYLWASSREGGLTTRGRASAKKAARCAETRPNLAAPATSCSNISTFDWNKSPTDCAQPAEQDGSCRAQEKLKIGSYYIIFCAWVVREIGRHLPSV